MLLAGLIFLNGCAFGTMQVMLQHNPLERIDSKKKGTILINTLVDKRKVVEYIGNKRNGAGMVLGHISLEEGVRLDATLTDYFADALKEAGYDVVIRGKDSMPHQGVTFDAVLDGEILNFWMDLYMKVWHYRHYLAVSLKASDPATGALLWSQEVKGEASRILLQGWTGEFERVIREAITKALNEAAREFASDSFYRRIKKLE